jgi:hypothetical protein
MSPDYEKINTCGQNTCRNDGICYAWDAGQTSGKSKLIVV